MAEEVKKKRKKKEKKKAIVISLWIDKVSYDYGILCTFCTKAQAVVHCSLCTDFYCFICDVTAHKTKKRRDHVRSTISNLDLNAAAHIVTRAVRFHGHLRTLQIKCRAKLRRFFDPKTLNHYYYNPVYGTVSWRRPYCLRREEFAPFLDSESAASRVQGLYHGWRARERVRSKLLEYYRKIFDRRQGRFYYANHGPSLLLPKQSWRRSRYCGKRSYPRDIKAVYTVDVAAIVIQRRWRAIIVREMFRAVARFQYDQIWDPLKGKWNYYHKEKEILLDQLPIVLKGQPWDPHFIPDWTLTRVSLFLRRCGLKRYVQQFLDYGVDGRTLVLLDLEDFDNIGVKSRVHIRKILMEIARIFKVDKKGRISDAHAARREKIRRAKMYAVAATLIQQNFRCYLARKELKLRREILRLSEAERRHQETISKLGVWWTMRPDIPSKEFRGDGQVICGEFNQPEVRFPAIKTFGRMRDHLSATGWGHRDGKGKWHDMVIPPVTTKKKSSFGSALDAGGPRTAADDELFLGDSNPTRHCTERLAVTGYDKRRFQRFMGLPVDKWTQKLDLQTIKAERAALEPDDLL